MAQRRKTSNRKQTSSLQRKRRKGKKRKPQVNYFPYIIIVVATITLATFALQSLSLPSNTSKKRRKNTKKKLRRVGVSDVKPMIKKGFLLVKKRKFNEAEPILRKAKAILLEKRSLCSKGTKEYLIIEKLLAQVSESHYQAYKNVRLK